MLLGLGKLAVRLLELGEERGVLDRDDGLVGKGLQQGDLALGEGSATDRTTFMLPIPRSSRTSGT